MRIPGLLKAVMVPIWNGGHRLAWTLGEYGGAVLHRRFDRCRVCGRFGPMLLRERAIPTKLRELWGLSPRVSRALARKETLDCSRCGAKLRARRLADVLLGTYPFGSPRRPSRSVREWVETLEAKGLRVAEINLIDGLHGALAKLPGLAYSDYEVPGVRHEDLTRLTYADESFDLVLTSETLEHVPDLSRALAEIRRVLVPGGWHLFTVPLLPNVPRTYPRIGIGAEGNLIDLHPPIRHPGGDVGYLVFTEFGGDLPEILEAAGFEARVHFGPATEDDIAQVYACRRR